jgi:glycosyltransferase involved in cell wall biosynthesis
MCVIVTTPLVIHFFFKPHLRELAQYFDLTLAYNQQSDRYLQPLNLPVCEVDVGLERKIAPLRDLFSFFRLFRLFGRERFDIVVSLVPKAGLLGMLAAWLLRVPRRVHIFQGEVWAARNGPMRWVLKSLDRLTARLATHVLAVSASELRFLEREGVIPPDKAKVLGAGSICGVDTKRFRPDPFARHLVRAQHAIPEQAVVCIFLGRLTVDKGVLDLAKAFAESTKHKNDLWLLLAGPDEDQLERRLRSLVPAEINSRMLTLGFTENPEQLLAAADFLCLPSHREGFGMVIAEAAAVGIPAIGTLIHGITDAIEDGNTGQLVAAGDVTALAKAITRWSECPQERSSYADRAHAHVITALEQENVVGKYVGFFRDLFHGEVH